MLLNENGLPMSVSGWQAMFSTAHDRGHKADVPVEAHAHLLRHTCRGLRTFRTSKSIASPELGCCDNH